MATREEIRAQGYSLYPPHYVLDPPTVRGDVAEANVTEANVANACRRFDISIPSVQEAKAPEHRGSERVDSPSSRVPGRSVLEGCDQEHRGSVVRVVHRRRSDESLASTADGSAVKPFSGSLQQAVQLLGFVRGELVNQIPFDPGGEFVRLAQQRGAGAGEPGLQHV